MNPPAWLWTDELQQKVWRNCSGSPVSVSFFKHRNMAKARRNHNRENRINEEIIVDAYGPEEQAMGGTTISKKGSSSRSMRNAPLLYQPRR
jgi:hypothetical protein